MKTDIEDRVKDLLAEGFSNKEIAQRVFRSERAVKWHVANLYVKYGLRGLADGRRLIVLLVKEKMG
jgi:DNA-binding NarL/FixJ family response regulator